MIKPDSHHSLITVCVLVFTTAFIPLAQANDDDAESNDLKCRFCPETGGTEERYELGLGYITDDDPEFGDAWGYDDKGYSLIGNAELYHRTGDVGFINLELRDIGLDSSYLNIEGGQQGHYRLNFEYNEISRRSFDSTVTPFRGSSQLSLPAGWVDADSTGNMPQLVNSLRDVEIGHQRERITLGAEWIPSKRWQWDVQIRQDRKTGLSAMAGSFITQASSLPAPVDFVTDEIESTLGYSEKHWHAQVGYYGSLFRNADKALTWENPYTPLSAGADQGQLSLPPDNQFHQLSLAYSYRPSPSYGLSSMLAAGRMTQDEKFVATTVNPNLSVALPRNSLDGEVDTLTGNVRAFYNPWRELRLTSEFLYNDRDNNTPRDNWQQVVTDVFTGSIRRNIPYTFNQQSYRFSADWKANLKNRLSAGVERDIRKRRGQAVERTDEDTGWLKWRLKPGNFAELQVKLSSSSRDGSPFQNLSSIAPPENPRMRQFHLADRDRDQANVHLNLFGSNDMQLGFGIAYANDSYRNSPIGLQSGKQLDFSGSATFRPKEHWYSNVFLTQTRIEASTLNSQSFSSADWRGESEDRITTIGSSTIRTGILGKFDLEVEYSHSRATGDVSVITGAPNPDFPALTSELHVFRSTTTYHFRPDLALRFGYWFELLRTRDWSLDDVTLTTLPGVLHLDQSEPSYKVHVFMLSTEYRF